MWVAIMVVREVRVDDGVDVFFIRESVRRLQFLVLALRRIVVYVVVCLGRSPHNTHYIRNSATSHL